MQSEKVQYKGNKKKYSTRAKVTVRLLMLMCRFSSAMCTCVYWWAVVTIVTLYHCCTVSNFATARTSELHRHKNKPVKVFYLSFRFVLLFFLLHFSSLLSRSMLYLIEAAVITVTFASFNTRESSKLVTLTHTSKYVFFSFSPPHLYLSESEREEEKKIACTRWVTGQRMWKNIARGEKKSKTKEGRSHSCLSIQNAIDDEREKLRGEIARINGKWSPLQSVSISSCFFSSSPQLIGLYCSWLLLCPFFSLSLLPIHSMSHWPYKNVTRCSHVWMCFIFFLSSSHHVSLLSFFFFSMKVNDLFNCSPHTNEESTVTVHMSSSCVTTCLHLLSLHFV